MSPRSFFILLIKLLGVYLILESISSIGSVVSLLLELNSDYADARLIATAMITILVFIAVFVLITRYTVFRPEWIIDKLRLDQGFAEEKFEITIHRSTVLLKGAHDGVGNGFIDNQSQW